MKRIWQFVRDDVWTYFAFSMFWIAILGLAIPNFYPHMPPIYGQLVFTFAAIFLSLRVLKLSILLVFGKLVTASKGNIEHYRHGICVVDYRFFNGAEIRIARRQIYHRTGELQALFLPRLAGFHLVAWQTTDS